MFSSRRATSDIMSAPRRISAKDVLHADDVACHDNTGDLDGPRLGDGAHRRRLWTRRDVASPEKSAEERSIDEAEVNIEMSTGNLRVVDGLGHRDDPVADLYPAARQVRIAVPGPSGSRRPSRPLRSRSRHLHSISLFFFRAPETGFGFKEQKPWSRTCPTNGITPSPRAPSSLSACLVRRARTASGIREPPRRRRACPALQIGTSSLGLDVTIDVETLEVGVDLGEGLALHVVRQGGHAEAFEIAQPDPVEGHVLERSVVANWRRA